MVIQRRERKVIPHQIPKQIANQRAQQKSQMGYSPGAWVWFGSVGLLLSKGRGLLSLSVFIWSVGEDIFRKLLGLALKKSIHCQ